MPKARTAKRRKRLAPARASTPKLTAREVEFVRALYIQSEERRLEQRFKKAWEQGADGH